MIHPVLVIVIVYLLVVLLAIIYIMYSSHPRVPTVTHTNPKIIEDLIFDKLLQQPKDHKKKSKNNYIE